MKILMTSFLILCTNLVFATCSDHIELSDSFNQDLVNRTKAISVNNEIIEQYKLEQAYMSAAVTIDEDDDYVVIYQLSIKAEGIEKNIRFNGSVVFEKRTCRTISESGLVRIDKQSFKYH